MSVHSAPTDGIIWLGHLIFDRTPRLQRLVFQTLDIIWEVGAFWDDREADPLTLREWGHFFFFFICKYDALTGIQRTSLNFSQTPIVYAHGNRPNPSIRVINRVICLHTFCTWSVTKMFAM
jgi:hypothetical protein